MQLFCIILSILITRGVIALQYFENKPLESSAGIYFEDLGNLQLYRSRWALVTYVDLKPLQGKEESLSHYLHQIKKLCHNNEEKCDFEMELNSLESKMMRLKLDKETVNDLIGHSNSSSTRPKRGLFDFIGKGLGVLFGTLDANDREYFTKQIYLVQQNTRKVTELFTEKISILRSTIDQFSQAFQESSTKFAEIDQNMQVLNRAITGLAKDVNKIKMNNMVHEHITRCSDMILEYEIGLEVLANAVLLGKRGLMHPKIMTPRQLFDALKMYNVDMIPGRKFPVPLELGYFGTLIDISDISLFYSDDKLVYVIQIPLSDVQDYRLYNLVPIPVKQSGQEDVYSFINPTETYMGLSNDRNTYTIFSDIDVNECKKYPKEYICVQSQPIYHVGGTNNNCETELIKPSGMANIGKQCDLRMARLQSTVWLQLKAPNTWIYAAPKKEVLQITCSGSIHRKSDLSSTGILSLSRDCDAVSEGVILPSRTGEMVRTIGKDFIPEFVLDTSKITEDIDIAGQLNVSELPLLNLGKIPYLNLESLRENSVRLADLYKEADDIAEQHRTQTSYEQAIFLACYLGYCIVGLIVVCVIVKIATSFKK